MKRENRLQNQILDLNIMKETSPLSQSYKEALQALEIELERTLKRRSWPGSKDPILDGSNREISIPPTSIELLMEDANPTKCRPSSIKVAKLVTRMKSFKPLLRTSNPLYKTHLQLLTSSIGNNCSFEPHSSPYH